MTGQQQGRRHGSGKQGGYERYGAGGTGCG